jgi:hypothetical protein
MGLCDPIGGLCDVRFTHESGHSAVALGMSVKCQKQTSAPQHFYLRTGD